MVLRGGCLGRFHYVIFRGGVLTSPRRSHSAAVSSFVFPGLLTNLKGGALQDFLRTFPRQVLDENLWIFRRSFGSDSSQVLGENLLLKFWERISFQVLGQNLLRSFKGEFGKWLGSTRLLSLLLHSGFGAPVGEPPPLGWGAASVRLVDYLYPSGEDASTSTRQARRRQNFDACRLPAPHVLGSPPLRCPFA